MRVLIADDSLMIRTILQDTLEDAGYEVVVCKGGEEAWKALSAGECRLAVLDWMMPDMSGLEVCEKLRAEDSANWVYAILLTAKKETESVTEAFHAGASDYVTKPFQREELLARLAV